ncbi:MAG: ribulose-phosphate 3-epimerase, partial [Dehalococcoidia bacterium]
MPAIKLAPSFLTADLGTLAEEVRAVEAAGADYLHLDVMDGHFVPPISFGQIVVAAIRKLTSLPLDVHLMVAEPERQLDGFAQATAAGGSASGGGADILSVHVEATGDLPAIIAQIRSLGRRPGVCLNPE